MKEKANIVRVTNVTKNFKLGKIEVEALKGIDLEISKGNYLSIMGPSGSGKSTLFNMIGGLDKPSSGKVYIDEVDIAQLDAYELAWLRCRKIGYIFQTADHVKKGTFSGSRGTHNGNIVALGDLKIYAFERLDFNLAQFKIFSHVGDAHNVCFFFHIHFL